MRIYNIAAGSPPAMAAIENVLEPLLSVLEIRRPRADGGACGAWEVSCRISTASKQLHTAVMAHRRTLARAVMEREQMPNGFASYFASREGQVICKDL